MDKPMDPQEQREVALAQASSNSFMRKRLDYQIEILGLQQEEINDQHKILMRQRKFINDQYS